jgi:hypothetical protein
MISAKRHRTSEGRPGEVLVVWLGFHAFALRLSADLRGVLFGGTSSLREMVMPPLADATDTASLLSILDRVVTLSQQLERVSSSSSCADVDTVDHAGDDSRLKGNDWDGVIRGSLTFVEDCAFGGADVLRRDEPDVPPATSMKVFLMTYGDSESSESTSLDAATDMEKSIGNT